MKQARIILVGCGPHARRVYLPALAKLRAQTGLELLLVIDLEATRETVNAALAQHGLEPQVLFIEPFEGGMPELLKRALSEFTSSQQVNGVIIATEPLTHRAYAEWALREKLNILMDKPVTARINSASQMESADGILLDYLHLLEIYQSVQAMQETVFIVNSQRRFHAGFCFVERLLREIGDKTGCPVTFMQSYHSDGQWRFPSEIVTQDYHPYCFGYGKASHSGYHIFDMLYRLYSATGVTSKQADSMEIVSSFVQPAGFIQQMTEADYYHLFQGRYDEARQWSDDQLKHIYDGYGEIDISAIASLKRNGEIVANLSINLVHNGFSRRTWIMPGQDLYKGNGRVKHEHHNIQQGPFQNIQIHSYQAIDRHDGLTSVEDDLGNVNHFDVYVFRNPLVTNSEKSLEVYKFSDILGKLEQQTHTQLSMESAKYQVIEEFIDYLSGRRLKAGIASQIEDHLVTVQIMSAVYRSHVLRQSGLDCVVRMPFGSAGDESVS